MDISGSRRIGEATGLSSIILVESLAIELFLPVTDEEYFILTLTTIENIQWISANNSHWNIWLKFFIESLNYWTLYTRMFYCRCISRIILMCLFHSFSWSLLADFTLTFTSWADPIPMKLFQISRSSNNILVKSMWYNLVCEFDFNFGQRIKASEFTNERVFGINIISNLCPYDQCIFQCNHSFDIDEIEVWSFSITNICQDSLTGFLGH